MTERLNSELEGERAKCRDLEEKLRMLEEVRFRGDAFRGWGTRGGGIVASPGNSSAEHPWRFASPGRRAGHLRRWSAVLYLEVSKCVCSLGIGSDRVLLFS